MLPLKKKRRKKFVIYAEKNFIMMEIVKFEIILENVGVLHILHASYDIIYQSNLSQ